MEVSGFNAHDDWESDVEVAPINFNKRLPAILLLDTSGSMSGRRINELNDALKLFESEFDPETGDPTAIRSIELAIVTFGAGGVQVADLRTGQGMVSAATLSLRREIFGLPVSQLVDRRRWDRRC